jgi:flagellar biosynthesis protein FliP
MTLLNRSYLTGALVALVVLAGQAGPAYSQATPSPRASGDATTQPANSLPNPGEVLNLIDKATGPKADGDPNDWSAPVKLAAVFAILAVLPSLLVMTTSFTRIVIVLSFLRRALTTQNIPPTVAVVGLALFLTLFTMAPTFTQINDSAIKPYTADEIDFYEACERGNVALKEFMFRQVRPADLQLFFDISGTPAPGSVTDIPAHILIPSFAISEFRKAFEMGCLIFIPFLLVDLVTSGILLSTGMMMLPPSMISLPFKIILFVLVDGWRVLAKTLVTSFA